MIKAYFEHIFKEIIQELDIAKESIKVCVAWFTDCDIYDVLVKKAREGVSVEVVLANHTINKSSRIDFKELLSYGGSVSYLGSINSGSKDRLMHNKFCLIDGATLMTGSYNWSYKARFNDENLLVIKNESQVIEAFKAKFYQLQPQFGFAIEEGEVSIVPIQKIMQKWNLNEEVKERKVIDNKSKILGKF